MNTTNNSNVIETLNKQIAILQSRKEIVTRLLEERNTLDEKVNRLLEGTEIPVTEKKQDGRKGKRMVFPRGVLTLSAFETLKSSNKPMHLNQILEAVKKSPLLHDNIPADLEQRLRGVLQTSEQFIQCSLKT